MNEERVFDQWRPHPWHGLTVGKKAPNIVNAYIEITPYDLMKYEVDKENGYLRVDRPQRMSSQPPALYGFVPRTYCGDRIGALCEKTQQGDGDPLDICVLSERPINRAEVLLDAKVIGGMQMIDDGDADDKIIGILANDNVWADIADISELPDVIADRLEHYFSTYKTLPGAEPTAWVELVYGAEHAHKVINAAVEDYKHLRMEFLS